MEIGENNEMVKRIRTSEEEKTTVPDDGVMKTIGEATEHNIVVSEQMELEIANIQEKISQFSQLVSELLESGKSMLSELINEFEGRMILIYKEQLEKWEVEIKELSLLDASNEEINAVLQNAKSLFQNVQDDS